MSRSLGRPMRPLGIIKGMAIDNIRIQPSPFANFASCSYLSNPAGGQLGQNCNAGPPLR